MFESEFDISTLYGSVQSLSIKSKELPWIELAAHFTRRILYKGRLLTLNFFRYRKKFMAPEVSLKDAKACK